MSFFLLFAGLPKSPKTMSLLPKSLKIITSAPQLPENKYPFSPDPQNPWGPSIVSHIPKTDPSIPYAFKYLQKYPVSPVSLITLPEPQTHKRMI